MTKTIDIVLALRWEENGFWNAYGSTFDKKLAACKFRVFCDSNIPGIPRSMNLVKAKSFAAHHKGEVIQVLQTASGWVGGETKEEAINHHLYYNRDNAAPSDGERQVAYIIRVPASSLVYGKLQGHIEGLEISDKARNRYLYKNRWGFNRYDEAEHERIQAGTSIYANAGEFIRYIPRSTER